MILDYGCNYAMAEVRRPYRGRQSLDERENLRPRVRRHPSPPFLDNGCLQEFALPRSEVQVRELPPRPNECRSLVSQLRAGVVAIALWRAKPFSGQFDYRPQVVPRRAGDAVKRLDG